MQQVYDHLLKILIIGARGVGKTRLFQRFAHSIFHESCQCIIGIDFFIRTLNVYKYTVKFQLWQLNGAERFRSLPSMYYRGAMGIVIAFDLTDRESFNRLTDLHKEAQEHAPEDAIILIVGTKADLEDQRKVTNEEAGKFADVLGYIYIETSAKTGMNVDNLFLVLAKEIIEKKKLKEIESNNKSKNVQKPNDTKRRPICIG